MATCFGLGDIPKGSFRQSTVRASILFEHHHIDVAIWEEAVTEPEWTAEKFLVERSVKCCDVQGPQGGPGRIKVVVRLAKAAEDAFLRLSGQQGVITTNFIMEDADRSKYDVIELPGKTRQQVVEQARLLGNDAFGACPKRGGWGVRILAANLGAMALKLRPEDHLTISAAKWEVSGLPEDMGPTGLSEFLHPECRILEISGTKKTGRGQGTRKTFFVKTEPAIFWVRKQGDDFLATCKLAEDRHSPQTSTASYRFVRSSPEGHSARRGVQSFRAHSTQPPVGVANTVSQISPQVSGPRRRIQVVGQAPPRMEVDEATGVKRKESEALLAPEIQEVSAMEQMIARLLDRRLLPMERKLSLLSGKVAYLEDQDDDGLPELDEELIPVATGGENEEIDVRVRRKDRMPTSADAGMKFTRR